MSQWFDINSIVTLQKNLINDLSGNGSEASQRAINNINSNLASLNTVLGNTSVAPTLTYQNQVNTILERENSRLVERKQAIDAAEQGQKRMVDLTNNTTLQNQAINQMYIVVAVALIIYLGIRLLSGFVPEVITDIMIIILVSATIIILVLMFADYNRRNNMDYNMINLGEPKDISGNGASSDSASSSNLLSLRFNGCVKESCCSEGTTFNEKYSICVPNLPPNDGNTQPGFKYFFAEKAWVDPKLKCGANGYSALDLSCNGNTVSAFTTISGSVGPNEPNEFADYNLYK